MPNRSIEETVQSIMNIMDKEEASDECAGHDCEIPPINTVVSPEGKFTFEVVCPGYSKKEISTRVIKGCIEVECKTQERKSPEDGYQVVEYEPTNIKFKIKVGSKDSDEFDKNRVHASLKNGILYISAYLKEEEGKDIPIK